MTAHATAWRRDMAQAIGAAYGAHPKVAAAALAGSTARGWTDRHSDIEIDVYWAVPPAAAEREAIIRQLGGRVDIRWADPPSASDYKAIFRCEHGKLSQLWPWESAEWSEHYYVRGVSIGVSGFLTATIAQYIDDVLPRCNVDDERQMRLAAIQHAVPLTGAELLTRWQARCATFPRALSISLINAQLSFDGTWWESDMWVERGAWLPLLDLLAHMQRKLLRILLALNGIYLPDPRLKWAHRLVGQLAVAPPNLAPRLQQLTRIPPDRAVTEVQTLLEETLALVAAHLPEVDTQFALEWYCHRRAIWDDAPPH